MARPILVPLGLGLVLVTAAACSSSGTVGTIDYRVTGGLTGRGDGTALHVEPDGTATRTSPTEGMVNETLDPATLDDLHRKVQDAGFPDLEPSYGCLGCGDEYVYELAVELDGQQYKVSVDSFAMNPPESLGTLVSTLKQLAHSH